MYPIWSVAPFVLLLVSIAIIPLVAAHWWEKNRNKALIGLLGGLPVAIFVASRDLPALGHTALDYAAFIALLGSLFVISGGIRVRGSIPGTPLGNTRILAIGALLSNLIGTTGASMLLIRPYLEANRERPHRSHLVVFFIIVVSNVSGCLTPLGDPPLFLGFLNGVPFTYTLSLWPFFLLVTIPLLVIFNLIDQHFFNKEDVADPRDLVDVVQPHESIRITGLFNFVLLAGVIGTVLASGVWKLPPYVQIGALVALAFVSLLTTPSGLRAENKFTWHPFIEVAILFAGIFAAMIPALEIMKTSTFGISHPAAYFWGTGTLSSFLDNAPTYLVFFSMAQSPTSGPLLAAISCGAVFFGAMTYIGNGPNFMVKAIAEESGVKMPSFFGYMKWSIAVLIPIFVVVTLVMFR